MSSQQLEQQVEEQPREYRKLAPEVARCSSCGRSFPHSAFLDHLFQNKDCMRAYWKEEEKTHIFRLRHRKPAKVA